MGIPYFEEGRFFFEKIIKYWQKHAQKRAVARIAQANASLGNPFLYSYLIWKYKNEPILQRSGETYPIAVYQAQNKQVFSPESILISLEKKHPATQDLKPIDHSYRKLMEIAGKPLENRQTFTMKELITEPQLGVRCELGNFFWALDTCESLEWEILDKAKRLKSSDMKSLKRFDNNLSLRSSLHARVEDPIRSGLSRSAAISISTLLVYNHEDSFNMWLRRRSILGVTIFGGLIHVIPSFMFQPATPFYDDEFSVTHNFYREYLEEIFNRSEPEDNEGDVRYFYGDRRLNHLQRLIQAHEADLYLSGISVNLLSLRPEICTVLLIRSKDWYKYHSEHFSYDDRFHLNSEWARLSNHTHYPGVMIGRIAYRATDEELMNEAPLRSENTTPQGAASFWLGIDLLRQLI